MGERARVTPQCLSFGNLILRLGLTLFEFVKSLRTGNFHLYVDTLKSIAQWMFALDHHNYARWLPVHLNEMCQLKIRNPNIYSEFLAGKFVVQKSNRIFSRIALDQNHEQENATIKGVGGAVGLTEDESRLQQWLVCGPEIARLIEEFEGDDNTDSDFIDKHHDSSASTQLQFYKDVKTFLLALETSGNPFKSLIVTIL